MSDIGKDFRVDPLTPLERWKERAVMSPTGRSGAKRRGADAPPVGAPPIPGVVMEDHGSASGARTTSERDGSMPSAGEALVAPLEAPSWFVSLAHPERPPFPRVDPETGDEDAWPCERCDGTGTEHVSFHAQWSGLREDGEQPCPDCRETGWLHGWQGSVASPARPVEAPEE